MQRTRRVAPGPAAAAVERIARRLERAGLAVPPSATVSWIRRRAQACWPPAAGALVALAGLAERELYSGAGGTADRRTVRRLWRQAKRGMKGSGAN
jgi:hypothetical protein